MSARLPQATDAPNSGQGRNGPAKSKNKELRDTSGTRPTVTSSWDTRHPDTSSSREHAVVVHSSSQPARRLHNPSSVRNQPWSCSLGLRSAHCVLCPVGGGVDSIAVLRQEHAAHASPLIAQ